MEVNMFDVIFLGVIATFILSAFGLMVWSFGLIISAQIGTAKSEKVFAPIASLLGMAILVFGLVGLPWLAARVGLPETQWGLALAMALWLIMLATGAVLMVCEEDLTKMEKARKNRQK
jgi:hypothetical protein